MKNIKPVYVVIALVIFFGLVFYSVNQNNLKKQNETKLLSITPTVVTTQQKMETDTSNWKTYFNNILKFSFKYPGDWILTDFPDQQEASLRFESSDYQLDSKFKPTKDAHVGPLLFGAKLDMYTSNKNRDVLKDYYPKEDTTGSSIKVLDRKEVIIDGQKGIRVETQWGQVKGFVSSAVTSLGRTYYFNIQYAQDKRDYFLKIFDEMLSTFKFTDQIGNYNNDMNDQNNLNSLVTSFYKALELQDGKLLFSYFTPPSTDKEKTDFNWLTGADLAGTPIYRVFFRQKISSPKINRTQGINNVFTVMVSDQLTNIPSTGSETTVYTPKTRNIVFTIIKSSDKWLVDKFTDPSSSTNSGNAGSPKYNGFGQ
ncbi:MAG: hypothetical protein Q7R95_08155 [bacterium]|nr:hypothetical protein [bacterium]